MEIDVTVPRTEEEWSLHCCDADSGERLRTILEHVRQEGSPYYEETKPNVLQSALPRIPESRLRHFIYDGGKLNIEERRALFQYLCKLGVFKIITTPPPKRPEHILEELHHSLKAFFDISDESIDELVSRVPGRYWIYRPSVHHPGHFVKGMLTVSDPSPPALAALNVTEHYFVKGDPPAGVHEFHEFYEGIMLQKAHHPFMLSSLRLPPHEHKEAARPGRADTDRTVSRIVMIARAQTHTNGKIVSMTGITIANYAVGGFLASPICFERIHPVKGTDAEAEMGIVTASDLPPSVLARMRSLKVSDAGWITL